MNIVWFTLGFIVGMLVTRYFENKEFKDRVNQYVKNIFKKKLSGA